MRFELKSLLSQGCLVKERSRNEIRNKIRDGFHLICWHILSPTDRERSVEEKSRNKNKTYEKVDLIVS